MPCTYYESPEEIEERTVGPYKRQINELTRMLCEIMHSVEGGWGEQYLTAGVEGLDEWWTAHKEHDKKQGRR